MIVNYDPKNFIVQATGVSKRFVMSLPVEQKLREEIDLLETGHFLAQGCNLVASCSETPHPKIISIELD
jgi:hypothetical protein